MLSLARANLEMDFFFRKCRAIEKKERSLSRLTSQLCDMEGAVDVRNATESLYSRI